MGLKATPIRRLDGLVRGCKALFDPLDQTGYSTDKYYKTA